MADEKKQVYYLNRDYGGGAARRRVRLTAGPGTVKGQLTDIFHEMRCELAFKDGVITDVAGETLRAPTSICPGATAVLDELVGLPVGGDMATFYAGGRAKRHCTHLLHLAALCAAHAGRTEEGRVYDIVIPDDVNGSANVAVSCNEVLVHRWEVRDHHIVAPPELAGRPMLSGFAAWATATFSGDALEAANTLSQAYFVGQARRYDTEAAAGQSLSSNSPMIGACFAYAPDRFATGHLVAGATRDFTNGVVETGAET